MRRRWRRTGVESINIEVVSGSDVLRFETHPSARVRDIKAMIHEQLGHSGSHPSRQKLCLGTKVLADAFAKLKDLQIADGSSLTLILSSDPLGHSLLKEPNGEKGPGGISEPFNWEGTPEEVLNEFQLMSLHEGWRHGGILEKEGEPWGDLGAFSMDFFWTTRNGCRYEYWSTSPGRVELFGFHKISEQAFANEHGALIRIDAGSVTCVGIGRGDGLHLFRDFNDDAVAMQLVREGWPWHV